MGTNVTPYEPPAVEEIDCEGPIETASMVASN